MRQNELTSGSIPYCIEISGDTGIGKTDNEGAPRYITGNCRRIIVKDECLVRH